MLTIEDVDTKETLREVETFFATHIPDASLAPMGELPLRLDLDPTSVALQIHSAARTVAAINSHAPANYAREAMRVLNDVTSSVRLMVETKLLAHIAVAPDHDGLGYAQALLEETEHRHRADPLVDLWFGFVDDRDHATLDTYERMGFTLTPDPEGLPAAAHVVSRIRHSRNGIWIYKNV